jgi:hypothetical protein
MGSGQQTLCLTRGQPKPCRALTSGQPKPCPQWRLRARPVLRRQTDRQTGSTACVLPSIEQDSKQQTVRSAQAEWDPKQTAIQRAASAPKHGCLSHRHTKPYRAAEALRTCVLERPRHTTAYLWQQPSVNNSRDTHTTWPKALETAQAFLLTNQDQRPSWRDTGAAVGASKKKTHASSQQDKNRHTDRTLETQKTQRHTREACHSAACARAAHSHLSALLFDTRCTPEQAAHNTQTRWQAGKQTGTTRAPQAGAVSMCACATTGPPSNDQVLFLGVTH